MAMNKVCRRIEYSWTEKESDSMDSTTWPAGGIC